MCVGRWTLEIVILFMLTGDASYALYTQLFLNVPAGSFLEYALNISNKCPKCDKKLIGMVKTTGDVPTFRMSPVSGLKTQNCPQKSAVTCAHTHTHTHTHTHFLSLSLELTFLVGSKQVCVCVWPCFFSSAIHKKLRLTPHKMDD